MGRTNLNRNTTPTNLASLIRGLYGRVARQLKLDPSYVSRVARGERRSAEIEVLLERELRRIMALVKTKRSGSSLKKSKAARAKAKKKVKA